MNYGVDHRLGSGMAVASSCISDSTPSLGTSTCHGAALKRKEKKKKKKRSSSFWCCPVPLSAVLQEHSVDLSLLSASMWSE